MDGRDEGLDAGSLCPGADCRANDAWPMDWVQGQSGGRRMRGRSGRGTPIAGVPRVCLHAAVVVPLLREVSR